MASAGSCCPPRFCRAMSRLLRAKQLLFSFIVSSLQTTTRRTRTEVTTSSRMLTRNGCLFAVRDMVVSAHCTQTRRDIFDTSRTHHHAVRSDSRAWPPPIPACDTRHGCRPQLSSPSPRRVDHAPYHQMVRGPRLHRRRHCAGLTVVVAGNAMPPSISVPAQKPAYRCAAVTPGASYVSQM